MRAFLYRDCLFRFDYTCSRPAQELISHTLRVVETKLFRIDIICRRISFQYSAACKVIVDGVLRRLPLGVQCDFRIFHRVVQDKFSAIRIGYAATVLLGIPPYEIPVRSIKGAL